MSNHQQLAATLLSERLIPVDEVPSIVPTARNGRPMHRSAVWRWVSKGLRGPVGERVRLEAVRIGRRWVTSHEGLARFFARLTPDPGSSDLAARPTSAPALRESTRSTLARHGLWV